MVISRISNRFRFLLKVDRRWMSSGSRFREAESTFKLRDRQNPFFVSSMPSPSIIPRYFSPTRDSSSFNHFSSPDSDQMIFGPIDLEDVPPFQQWDPYTDLDADPKPAYNFTPVIPMSNYEYGPQLSPTDSHSSSFYSTDGIKSPEDNNLYLSHWINDPELSPSSPIPIPSPSDTQPSSSSSFVAYGEHVHFPADGTFSPASFAALHPLPGSMSPSSSFEDLRPSRNIVDSVSPRDTALHAPSWASQLWESVPSSLRSPSHVRPSVRHSPMTDGTTVRQRTISLRRGSLSAGQIFQSSSAPAMTDPHASSMNRSYSRRSESASVADDRDATVRRKKRSPPTEDIPAAEKSSDSSESCCGFLIITHHPKPFLHSPQVGSASTKAGTLRVAAILHRLDTTPASLWHTQIKCCSGSQGGRARIRVPQCR